METITDVDNTDDLVVLANTPAKASSIGLYMNWDKTKFMSFPQGDTTSSLNGKPLKLIDQFIYLNSNISSTESNNNICIGKV